MKNAHRFGAFISYKPCYLYVGFHPRLKSAESCIMCTSIINSLLVFLKAEHVNPADLRWLRPSDPVLLSILFLFLCTHFHATEFKQFMLPIAFCYNNNYAQRLVLTFCSLFSSPPRRAQSFKLAPAGTALTIHQRCTAYENNGKPAAWLLRMRKEWRCGYAGNLLFGLQAGCDVWPVYVTRVQAPNLTWKCKLVE